MIPWTTASPGSPWSTQAPEIQTQEKQAVQATPTTILHESFGGKIEKNYQTLIQGALGVIQGKMSLAGMAGAAKNPGSQIQLLLSAFGDTEWYINSILSDFQGLELSPELRSLIARMRMTQSTLTQQINGVTGLNLTDLEMRALLEGSKDSIESNIHTNDYIRTFDAKTLQPDSTDGTMDFQTKGLATNPLLKQQLLSTANKKVVRELQSIVQQAAAMLAAAEANPEQCFGLLVAALQILQRGQQITEVAKALSGFQAKAEPTGAGNPGTFDQSRNQLNLLVLKALQLLGAQAGQKEDSPNREGTANPSAWNRSPQLDTFRASA